jgi:hypothetical protein
MHGSSAPSSVLTHIDKGLNIAMGYSYPRLKPASSAAQAGGHIITARKSNSRQKQPQPSECNCPIKTQARTEESIGYSKSV